MNPVELVTPELVEHCKNFTVIVVCGFTKTGKVAIAKKLSTDLNRHLLISDDYGIDEFELFKDSCIGIYKQKMPVIIEGVLSFRLLRKGVQEGTFLPDLIIKTNCNEATIRYFYEKDGEVSKINRALSFNKGLNTIWDEYRNILKTDPKIKRPSFLELNTSL